MLPTIVLCTKFHNMYIVLFFHMHSKTWFKLDNLLISETSNQNRPNAIDKKIEAN